MPDFTYEQHSQCKSMDFGNIGGYEQTAIRGMIIGCTYPSFEPKMGNMPYPFEVFLTSIMCEHLLEFEKSRCTWHSMYGESQVNDGVCPECGGETEYVTVAI